MLWIDKYSPKSFETLQCHSHLTFILSRLAQTKEIPHLLFYGPPGGGKKTRIMALLQALFNDSVYKVRAESVTPEGINAEFICTSSMFHTQITASELQTKDRVCVQYMIKQAASQAPATSYTSHSVSVPKYRAFIIQEAELLSAAAQAGLRRTLEKFSRNARIILHCHQSSSIIAPLRSRFLCIRVPLPTNEEVFSVLTSIRFKEGVNWITNEYLNQIVQASKRNLRQAILMLEVAAMQKCPPIDRLRQPWTLLCQDIVTKVVSVQGMTSLLDARGILYDLLTSLIPAESILLTLCKNFIQSTSCKNLQYDYTRAGAHYALTLKLGSKDIYHLEAFIAQCIHFTAKYHGNKDTQCIAKPK